MWFRLDAGATADEVTWRREKRVILDIIVQHADVATLEAVLDHLEESVPGTRWSPR
jgi:hypothetical protein